LKGGSALRARLTNIAAVPETFASEWADLAADDMRKTKPHSTRPASSRFTTKATRTRAGVYGAFWWIFVDDIEGRKARALSNQQTIFGTKVHLKRMRRRPFISKAAQGALSELGTDAIVQAWNGRRLRGAHKAFL
jgi:hypothetical protein